MNKLSIPAATAALLLIAGLSKCGLPRAAVAPPAPAYVVTAGNVTVTRQEVQAGWQNASAILRLSTMEHVGEIVLVTGGNTFCSPAHCYAEAPGVWFADWGNVGDFLRLFANGHAEGRQGGKDFYFTPLGSGECLPEYDFNR